MAVAESAAHADTRSVCVIRTTDTERRAGLSAIADLLVEMAAVRRLHRKVTWKSVSERILTIGLHLPQLFLHPSLPLLIHHFVQLHLSYTPGLKPTSFTNPTPVVSLLSPGLLPRTFA